MTKTRALIIDNSNFEEEIRSKIAHFFIILSKSQPQEGKNKFLFNCLSAS